MDKFSNADIEKMISNEADSLIPDLLEKIKKTPLEVDRPKTKRIGLLRLVYSLIFGFIIAGGGTFTGVYASEYQTISIDVNPSVELVVNRFDRVIKVNYNNIDAYNTFNDLNIKNKKLETAIDQCIDKLYENNYFSKDNEFNLLILSGYQKRNTFDDNKLDSLGHKCFDYGSPNNKFKVLTNVVDKEEYQMSKDYNMTFGQVAMAKMIMGNKPEEFKMDDFRNKDLHELKDMFIDSRGGEIPPWSVNDMH